MKNNEDSPEKKWTKSGELAKSGEWRRNPGRKEDAVEMIHNSWRGLFGTAFWLISVAELIFPNEATWQSGRPREPLSERTKYIWSPNKEAVAGVLIDKQCIEASKVEWNGNVGSTKWLWSMEGTSQEGWLELPRYCRRLHFLRGWGHDKTRQIFTRGKGAGGSDGLRA